MRKNEASMDKVRSVVSITAGEHVVDGAGVKIHRLIGTGSLGHVDPFVLLDEIKSTDPKDYVAGFPTHPHRGIETITYMKNGNFRHRDSRGGGGLLSPGCVQWMTAGSGILHSEMPERAGGLFWGYQLWLSLPAKLKMTKPAYQHISSDMIPEVKGSGVSVRIISGSYEGVEGPAKNRLAAEYFEVEFEGGAHFGFTLDDSASAFIYAQSGSVTVAPGDKAREVPEGSLAVLGGGTRVSLQGGKDSASMLFLASHPNNEPIVRRGPFVMNTEEEIRQAYDDYRSGALG